MSKHQETGTVSCVSKTEEIRQDRWFKLKWDRFISGISTRHSQNSRVHIIVNNKPWYELNYEWEQLAGTLAEGSKYSVEDVKAFMEEQYNAAKLEAILEDN